jgi:hypothetical protein
MAQNRSPLHRRHLNLWSRLDEGKGSMKTPRPPSTPGVPSPRLPLQPGPIAPQPAPGRGSGARPPLAALPNAGPYDPRAPLSWDAHIYPDPAPPSKEAYDAHASSYADAKLIHDALKRKKEDRPALPAPRPGRPRLPAPDRPRLPAAFSQQDEAQSSTALELLREPRESGLVSTSPLDLLDAYLKSQGIRYFSAWEITQHKWRHTRQVVPEINGKRSSAWSHLYDLFPPKIIPKGVHFLLARCVVPHPDLWASIIPSLWILDRFRHWLNSPVAAISGFRHPWYNTQIQGSSTSFHMAFAAVDFTYGARRDDGHLDTSLFVGFFERLYRRPGDGVGRYGSRFIHLDVGMDRHKKAHKGLDWWRPRELKGVLP